MRDESPIAQETVRDRVGYYICIFFVSLWIILIGIYFSSLNLSFCHSELKFESFTSYVNFGCMGFFLEGIFSKSIKYIRAYASSRHRFEVIYFATVCISLIAFWSDLLNFVYPERSSCEDYLKYVFHKLAFKYLFYRLLYNLIIF